MLFRSVILSLYPSADGPSPYAIAREADITIVAFHRGKVILNYAFRKGQLDDQAIAKFLADIPKLIKQP